MRKVAAFAVVMMALSASMAVAASGEFVMGAQGGITVPTGDFGDVANSGFNAGVYGDYGIANNCTIGASAVYHGFSGSDEWIDFLGVDDASFSLVQVTAHGRYWFPTGGQVMPFLTVGGGLYNFGAKAELGDEEADDSESNGGIYGGFGLDFRASPMWTIGVEGTYHNVFTEDESTNVFGVSARIGMSFAGQTE
jgi:hypothetical protein